MHFLEKNKEQTCTCKTCVRVCGFLRLSGKMKSPKSTRKQHVRINESSKENYLNYKKNLFLKILRTAQRQFKRAVFLSQARSQRAGRAGPAGPTFWKNITKQLIDRLYILVYLTCSVVPNLHSYLRVWSSGLSSVASIPMLLNSCFQEVNPDLTLFFTQYLPSLGN